MDGLSRGGRRRGRALRGGRGLPLGERWSRLRALATGATSLQYSDAGDTGFRDKLLDGWNAENDNATDLRPVAEILGTPTAERRFVLGDRLQLAAEGYVPAAAADASTVTFEVERVGGGVVLRRQETPPALGRPDLRDVSVPVDAGSFRAGQYLLRVRLEAPGSKPAERSVPFELLAASRSRAATGSGRRRAC